MAEIYFQGRTKEKRDTDANFTSSNIVLLDGEVVIVDMPDGEVRRKIGDGVTPYGQLPFDDEVVREKIDGLAEKIGDLDQLDTTAKTDLVAAINEIKSGGGIKRFTGTDLNDLKTPGVYISDEQKLHFPSENIGDWIIIVTGTMAKTQYALPPDDASLYYRTVPFGSTTWAEWKTFAKTEDVTGITGDLDDLTTSAKTNLVAAVNEVLATANKKLDLIQLEPTSNRATVDIPTGGCVLVVTANHTVTLTFNGNAGDLVILVNNTTGNIRNFALSPVLPSNNIAVILMDGEHAGQSLFRTDVIPDSVEEVTGDLENLTTTAKDSLVAAINEIANGSGGQITVQELGQIGNISALDNIKEYGIYSYDLLSEKCWLIVSYDAMAQSGMGYTSQYDFSAGNGIRWRNYSDDNWSTWETLDNKSTIGNMNDLSTNEKSSLVAAINEIAAGSGGSSDLPIVVSDTLPEDDYIPDRGEIRITQNTSTSSQASQIDIYSSDRKYGAPITHGGLVQLRVSSSFNNGDMYPYCGDIGFRYRNNNIDGNGQWSEWYRFKDIIAKLDSLESRVAALES